MKRIVTFVLLILISLAVGFAGGYYFKDKSNKPSSASELQEQDSPPVTEQPLAYDPESREYSGTFSLEGYVEFREVSPIDAAHAADLDSFAVDEKGNFVGAFFHYSSSSSNLVENIPHANVEGERVVFLGCKIGNSIQAYNKRVKQVIYDEGNYRDFEKLVGSSKQNPVTLQMHFSLPKFGSGAPMCYTFFDNYKVIKY